MTDRKGRVAMDLRSRLALLPLGFGGAVIGGLFGRVTPDDARATLDAAMAGGFSYIDTAPHYGRGLSERRIGDAVRERTDVLISTKVGRLMCPDASITDDRERDGFFSAMPFRPVYDYSGDGILRSFEASLQRLGLAHVSLLLVHDIGRINHGERHTHYWDQLTLGGGFAALERLRDEGAIDGFGIGVNEVAVCLDAIRAAPLDIVLLAGRYTLLEQEPLDTLFPACLAADVQVIVGGPYNSGILVAGDADGRYNYGRAPAEIMARVRRMAGIAKSHGVPLPAAALQFPLAHPAVACVIPGLRNPDEVHQTLDWFRHSIPDAFWADLLSAGLLRADAPLPQERCRP